MSFTARGYYLHEHDESPVEIRTADDVRGLLDAMLTQPKESSVVTLYIAERPKLDIGGADHELRIGVLADRKVGSVSFISGKDRHYAKGLADPDPIRYQYAGHLDLFPADSLVDLDVLLTVAADFLASGAERLPDGAEWASWPTEPLDEDEGGWF